MQALSINNQGTICLGYSLPRSNTSRSLPWAHRHLFRCLPEALWGIIKKNTGFRIWWTYAWIMPWKFRACVTLGKLTLLLWTCFLTCRTELTMWLLGLNEIVEAKALIQCQGYGGAQLNNWLILATRSLSHFHNLALTWLINSHLYPPIRQIL